MRTSDPNIRHIKLLFEMTIRDDELKDQAKEIQVMFGEKWSSLVEAKPNRVEVNE